MATPPGDDVATEAVRTLLDRLEFVQALLDDPKDKRTLVSETDVSRSTVNRAVRDLEGKGLIERTNGEYRPTAYGELLADEFTSLLETAAFAWNVRDVLEQIPADELDFDLARLADATITTPTPANPSAPLERVVQIKRTASTLRSLASGRSPGALDAHERGLEAGDAVFETVLSEELLAWLAAGSNRRQRVADLLAYDDLHVYVCDDDIPVPLGITEDVVFFGVSSPEGAPVALVESTDQSVRDWAVETFEATRDAAERVTRDHLEEYADS
ncbi:helix-turn-helix transcriptional regulator [Halobacterium bonnevillei]|uniref:GntR family transcriptional regulator n=1 Tax=Halobacterium bonnevillei TaxID=2692200 RepID=A0A6B0SQW2_9EURY|nr:helix-turn-helix domain-containing protein [Halobacterium bonnevillei]MXR19989.1 GntR family transcriptional regulator [Halobacterium bonnevillei]